MGNQPSKTPPQSATSSAAPNDQNAPPRRSLKRRDSHVSPLAKTTPAPPTASLESAVGTSASQSPSSGSRSRGRTPTTPSSGQKARDTSIEMGNQTSSEQEPVSKSAPIPDGTLSPGRRSAQAAPPIKTDFPPNAAPVLSPTESSTPSPTPTPYYLPPSQFIRPPRLPLPIEDDLLSPGSPILSPTDISSDVTRQDVESVLPRKSSVLSSTTMDEDDIGDEIFRPLDNGAGGQQAVDTLIEWKQGGQKVYVTGTFANFWNKKFKLHENGPSKYPKALSAIIPLPPGTHHVTFLVDGQMCTASHMPTAVDWTNALVNYIEVAAPSEPSKPNKDAQQPGSTQKPDIEPKQPTSSAQPTFPPTPELRPTHGTHSSQPIPAASASTPTTAPSRALSTKTKPQPTSTAATKKVHTDKPYFSEIPRFLVDLDAPEESSRYTRASAVMGTQPAPPSLPMFLNKSILNGATPMKDDSSVLVMPNHTVLNHLATSSIKNGVLATSATTRYKKKYVTTILYKPTSETAE